MTELKKKLLSIMEEFLLSCHDQTDDTIHNKRRILTDFILSFSEESSGISYEDIVFWQQTKNVSRNTLNGYLCIIRQFLKTASFYGIKCAEVTIAKYDSTYIPYIFSDAQIADLIRVADDNTSLSRCSSTKTFCFPMIIRLLAFTGMRLREVLTLKKNSYDKEKGILHLTQTKRRKERIVPLHPSLNMQMNKYFIRIDAAFPKSEYLFPQNDGLRHITKGQAEYEFNKLLNTAGIRKKNDSDKRFKRSICIHCLRHYFAISSFRKLQDEKTVNGIEHLSVYLGHTGILETEVYLKFSHDTDPKSLKLFEEYTQDIFEGLNQYE